MKVDWITKLPKVLCMQLNRLKFEQGMPVKVLDPLIVEKVIYPDRFIVQNRQESEKIRQAVSSLREKIRHLEKCLSEYNKFQGTEYNIARVLELAAAFFKEQGRVDESYKQIPDI
jgi:hypothetical protein